MNGQDEIKIKRPRKQLLSCKERIERLLYLLEGKLLTEKEVEWIMGISEEWK